MVPAHMIRTGGSSSPLTHSANRRHQFLRLRHTSLGRLLPVPAKLFSIMYIQTPQPSCRTRASAPHYGLCQALLLCEPHIDATRDANAIGIGPVGCLYDILEFPATLSGLQAGNSNTRLRPYDRQGCDSCPNCRPGQQELAAGHGHRGATASRITMNVNASPMPTDTPKAKLTSDA